MAYYEKLRSCDKELLKSNLSPTVKIDVDSMFDSMMYFSNIYVYLKGVNDGWVEG